LGLVAEAASAEGSSTGRIHQSRFWKSLTVWMIPLCDLGRKDMLAGRQQEIQAERLDVGCRRAALGGGTDREWKNQAAGGRGAVGWKQPVLWLPSAKTTALLQRCGESAATSAGGKGIIWNSIQTSKTASIPSSTG